MKKLIILLFVALGINTLVVFAEPIISQSDTIPFTIKGSRIYFLGLINKKHEVEIQFDLGAGGSCVNKNSSDKLQLSFDGETMLSNTQGVNKARTSSNNKLVLGNMKWENVGIVEVGNMQPHEDIIIGNSLFRDKVLEIDYDNRIMIVHDQLPEKAKLFNKHKVLYEQHRPKFKVDFIHNGEKFSHWFFFDTGREGTMVIGEDFTQIADNWEKLKELTMLNERKIVHLDVIISSYEFKDVVTNATDPAKPTGRPTLLGNQVLSQFNVILDNLNSYLYLKPNSRIGSPYSHYSKYEEEMAKISKK